MMQREFFCLFNPIDPINSIDSMTSFCLPCSIPEEDDTDGAEKDFKIEEE